MFKQISILLLLVILLVNVDPIICARNKRDWLRENDAFVRGIKLPLDKYIFPEFKDLGPSFFEHVNHVINAIYTNGIGASMASSRFITSIWDYVADQENPYTTGVVGVTGDYIALLRAYVNPQSILYNVSATEDNRIKTLSYQMIHTAALEYTTNLNEFNNNITDPQRGIDLRQSIVTLATTLQELLAIDGEFRTLPLEQLTIFSLAATSQVLLLTDIARWGTRWGISGDDMTAYNTLYHESIVEYTLYAKDVFDATNDPIAALTNIDGSGRFDNFQELRRVIIPQVSDFVAMWYNLDPKIAIDRGFHAERIRYLFSSTIGYSVDQSMINSVDIMDYMSPSFERLQEMWWALEQEDYKGDLTSVNFLLKENDFIYTAQPVYTTSRPITGTSLRMGAEVGSTIIDQGQSSIFEWRFPPTSSPQNVSYQYDHHPRKLTLSGSVGLVLDGGCATTDDYCHGFYGLVGQRNMDDIAAPGHKIGTVFGWGVNERTTLLPALDALSIGLLPANVFPNNLVLKDTTTVIDAQKYQSVSGGTYFEPEFYGPGYHVMFIPVGGSITYQFELNNIVDQSFDLYLRVSTGSKVPLSIKVSQNTVDVATFTLPYFNKNSIVDTTPDFDMVLSSTNATNNIFTFTALGSIVRLTSVILVPK
ncbi:hypothetical protein SAMD00019534_033030 [Acytostelium subglobosum LB1]|uniref:hypothetical protein n=1 Tax=Acytostelium subglobosum LB1 TaxID=1410327 RepID=UPI000644C6BE|nr:hypothetical protein SAMD00019534_033030 [Acytostelium subglobosum LB1]GAM20128.1 hypothetical protein SAMD00019534_033030 [Acytostelium subglobosum LB1]|eukprot:XP_012756890.1 hypothetical protein SAMD00019534_033030 [Acytostelium subglobosum LB1]